jgi:molybdenum cofactor biosynthesis enzyme MoaA
MNAHDAFEPEVAPAARGGRVPWWRDEAWAAVPGPLAFRGLAGYLLRRPWCLSFELTHNCNARCGHCHRGDAVVEQRATPQRLVEVCRKPRPIVAILSGGEPLLYPDLGGLVRLLKARCAPLRVFLNTNGALLTPARFAELVEAGVDEVLVSLDYPDDRQDAFRAIPGLFARIRDFVAALPPRERRRVVLTTVFQADNYREAPKVARLALDWGVNANFSAYTPPCGLHVRAYATHAALKRQFTARNDCSECYTSTRGNSERPLRNLVLDHVDHLRRRAEA